MANRYTNSSGKNESYQQGKSVSMQKLTKSERKIFSVSEQRTIKSFSDDEIIAFRGMKYHAQKQFIKDYQKALKSAGKAKSNKALIAPDIRAKKKAQEKILKKTTDGKSEKIGKGNKGKEAAKKNAKGNSGKKFAKTVGKAVVGTYVVASKFTNSMQQAQDETQGSSSSNEDFKVMGESTAITYKGGKKTGKAVKKLTKQSARTIRNARKIKKQAKQAKRAARTAKKTSESIVKTVAKIMQRVSQLASQAVAKMAAAIGSAIAAAAPILIPILLVVLLLCVIFVVLGGSAYEAEQEEAAANAGSYECQVSAEVEAYRDLVAEYCEKYGIDDYVDLVLAMIQQESGGEAPDVMQTKSSYHNPNPDTTPSTAEESIDYGVHELADNLTTVSCSSPSNIAMIKIALQGYNYGNGFAEWCLNNYGYWDESVSLIFQNMMKLKTGSSTYGDVLYPTHVLQYYSVTATTTVTNEKAKAIIEELKENNDADEKVWSLIEKGASLVGSVTYSMSNRQDDGRDNPTVLDCSSFVAWTFHKSGYSGVPYASTTATFSSSKNFVTVDASDLQVGDIGLKGENLATGGSNHVGIYCGKLKNGTKVWLHCTSSGSSLTGNSEGVMMSNYTNFTFFRRLKKWYNS